jgi:hypothetical protein
MSTSCCIGIIQQACDIVAFAKYGTFFSTQSKSGGWFYNNWLFCHCAHSGFIKWMMVTFTHIFHPTILVVTKILDEIFAIKRTLMSNPKSKCFGNTKVNERNEWCGWMQPHDIYKSNVCAFTTWASKNERNGTWHGWNV